MSKRRKNRKPQPQQNKVETREQVSGIDVIDADAAVAAHLGREEASSPKTRPTAPARTSDAVVIENLPEEEEKAEESGTLQMDYVTDPGEKEKDAAPEEKPKEEEETLDLAYEEPGKMRAAGILRSSRKKRRQKNSQRKRPRSSERTRRQRKRPKPKHLQR